MNSLFTPAIAAAVSAEGASLGLTCTLLLLALLVKRVLFEGVADERAARLVEALGVAIVPLLATFGLIVIFRIGALLP